MGVPLPPALSHGGGNVPRSHRGAGGGVVMRRVALLVLTLLSTELCAHTPPDPPQETMGRMSAREMTQMMQMDDTHPFETVRFDQLEWRDARGKGAGAWDAQAWY